MLTGNQRLNDLPHRTKYSKISTFVQCCTERIPRMTEKIHRDTFLSFVMRSWGTAEMFCPNEDEILQVCLFTANYNQQLNGKNMSKNNMKMNMTEINLLRYLCFVLSSRAGRLFDFHVNTNHHRTIRFIRDDIWISKFGNVVQIIMRKHHKTFGRHIRRNKKTSENILASSSAKCEENKWTVNRECLT